MHEPQSRRDRRAADRRQRARSGPDQAEAGPGAEAGLPRYLAAEDPELLMSVDPMMSIDPALSPLGAGDPALMCTPLAEPEPAVSGQESGQAAAAQTQARQAERSRQETGRQAQQRREASARQGRGQAGAGAQAGARAGEQGAAGAQPGEGTAEQAQAAEGGEAQQGEGEGQREVEAEGEGEGEGGESEGESEGEGEGEEAAAPAGAGDEAAVDEEVAPEPLPPRPQPPRLGGIEPKHIPPPPRMSEEDVREVLTRTGRKPEAHHALLRRRVQDIAAQARRLQARIVREAREAALDVTATFMTKASEVPMFTADAEERVAGAYGGARARVRETADAALATLGQHETEASTRLDTSMLTMEQQIQRVLASSSPAVQALHAEQLGVVQQALDEYAGKFRRELGERENAVRSAAPQPLTEASDPVHAAMREAEEKTWKDRAKQKADDMHRGIEQNANMVLGQREMFSVAILQLVNPAAVQLEQVATHQEGEVGGARTETRLRVATDYERAVNAVTQFRDTGLAQLDQGEQGAIKEIRAIGARLQADVEQRGANLEISILETARDLAEAYRVQMDGFNESIDTEGKLEIERFEPALDGAKVRFDQMYESQSADLDTTVEDALAETDENILAQMASAHELADNSASEAWKIANQQIASIDTARDAFMQALSAPADQAQAQSSPFTATSSESLGQRPEQVRASVKRMVDETKVTLQTTLDDEKLRLQGEVDDLAASLRSALIADADAKILDLNQRAQRAYNAMVGAGTNESALMASLRNITAIQGSAIEAIWDDRPFGDSLRKWLDDDLSGDEERAALSYLAGDTAAGARFELDASMSWYGDDEQRIEEVMRDLEAGGHMEAIRNDPAWASTLTELRSSLDGTDLDVTNALLAGNRHRADALRLRDSIEAARREGDHDRVHQLLEGVPDQEMDDVRREFAAIERGLGPEQQLDISDDDAREIFVEFVTRDREVVNPGAYEHGGPPTRTVTIEGANRRLAVALASRGGDREGSPADIQRRADVQAARMEVEVSRGGDSPNLANLQRAFEYDQAAEINDDLRSPDPQVRQQAEQRRDQAREVRQRAMQQFATQHGGLQDATPEQAQRYAEQTVGGLFSDATGREFGESMVRDGFADPAVAMRLAVQGGTDEDLIRRTLSRMDADQIAAMREDYQNRYGEDLDERLGTNGKGGTFTELSGDDRLEVDLLMRGRPRNDLERYQLELARTQQQRSETGFLGRELMSGSTDEALMEDSNRRLVGMVEEAGGIENAFDESGRFIGANPTVNPQTGELEPSREDALAFRVEQGWNKFGAEAYQAGIDRMTNYITTALAVIAAVVVSILVPGVGGAVAGALIGGLLSMGAKAAIKGGRYGWEEAGVDLAVTAVDALTAGLTHGMGQAMRTAGTVAKGASVGARRTAGVLSGVAARGRAGRAFAYVASEAAENFVSSAPSAFVGQVLNDRNWEHGNPFTNILGGTLMEAGISTGVGLGMGVGMDALGAVRGAMRDRSLRNQLTASMTPEMRHAFADVPIMELPPRQFEAMTGSQSGQAVTVLTPDGPVIYMREGANPRVLREEGIHLMQTKEGAWARQTADLDEANLGRWNEMSLSEQLALYRSKLELEIDAQRRLLDDLEVELMLAGPLSQRGLRRRIAEVEQSLGNLQRRSLEIERFTPERMQRISMGEEPRPQYLEQPPRLFNKQNQPRVTATEPDFQGQRTALPTKKGDPDYSPLSGRTDIEGTVVEIGPRWVEPNGREYRLVGVVDADGNLSHVRQEIRSAHGDERWVQRGSESRDKGMVAEAASRRMSAVDVRPGWQTTPIASQWDGSGRGFDEVLLDFRMEGDQMVARVRVVEVKDYPGSYVPLESFTAIRPPPHGSLDKNLDFIQRRLNEIGTLDPPDGYGLTREQVDAASLALLAGDVDLEIRLTPETNLGARDRGTVLKDLEAEWRNHGIPITQAQVREIDATHMAAAQAELTPTATDGVAPRTDAETTTVDTPRTEPTDTGTSTHTESTDTRTETGPEAKPEAKIEHTGPQAMTGTGPQAMTGTGPQAMTGAGPQAMTGTGPHAQAQVPRVPTEPPVARAGDAGPVRPTGASGPSARPTAVQPAGGQRIVVEPFIGPSVDSPLHLMSQHPGALVVGTEARIRPSDADLARLEAAGGVFLPDNMPAGLPANSVDQMVMRFPLPHDRAIGQDIPRRLAELERLHPPGDDVNARLALMDRAVRDAQAAAETVLSYAPYALQRLRPGGELEVVFWEREIIDDLQRAGQLRYIDPETGQGYRLEIDTVGQVERAVVAPHSGFGIPASATTVFQARLRKVALESRPTGARGPDPGDPGPRWSVGEASNRPFRPDQAGGPVRPLDWRKAKITDRGVDVVEGHIRRFDGGGELELAMVERLRRIARGELEPTEHDLRFYTHELREFVRYRRLGQPTGQPRSDEAAYDLWNDAHTATLEDYGLREGPGVLYHPDVEAQAGLRRPASDTGTGTPTGAGAGAGPGRLPAVAPLDVHVRRAMEVELAQAGHARTDTAALSDDQLADLYTRVQRELLPERMRAFRDDLAPAARAEFDALSAAGHLQHTPVDAALATRLGTALDTPVHVDPTLAPGEVRVHYDVGPMGNVRGVEIRVGSKATLEDVLLHVPTLAALRRYEGVTGVLRRVIDAVRRYLRGGGSLPVGSRAHEAWLEVQKLPALIQARRNRLASQALDSRTRLALELEVRNLEAQLARHLDALDQTVPGIGHVAGAPDGEKVHGPDGQVRQEVVDTWHERFSEHLPLTDAEFRTLVGEIAPGKLTTAELEAMVPILREHAELLGRIRTAAHHIEGQELSLSRVLGMLADGTLTPAQLQETIARIPRLNQRVTEVEAMLARIRARAEENPALAEVLRIADPEVQQEYGIAARTRRPEQVLADLREEAQLALDYMDVERLARIEQQLEGLLRTWRQLEITAGRPEAGTIFGDAPDGPFGPGESGVPGRIREDPRYDELKRGDLDSGDNVEPKNRREAMAAVQAMDDGLIPGTLRRPTDGPGDFVETTIVDGQVVEVRRWDVKSEVLTPGLSAEAHAYEIQDRAQKIIEASDRYNVILDVSYMSHEDAEALVAALMSHPNFDPSKVVIVRVDFR